VTFNRKTIVLASPFLIILINFGVALFFGEIIGKWAFIPIVLIEWCLFVFFIIFYGGKAKLEKWLRKPKGSFGWNIPALIVGILPLPLFIFHYETLAAWQVWVPWILLALINPFLEEFYWRGLLLDYTQNLPNWVAILFTSSVFALNHAVFGVNSELNRGVAVIISTFVMGGFWALAYKKTGSLRWAVFAHFLVDFLNISAASFLDLYEKGAW
jgi:membrane protease YdiL (CAAX protease family)